jgi:hypothetical protein
MGGPPTLTTRPSDLPQRDDRGAQAIGQFGIGFVARQESNLAGTLRQCSLRPEKFFPRCGR